MRKKIIIGISFFLILISYFTFVDFKGDWALRNGGLDNLRTFFFESLWPPDWSVLEPRTYPVCERDIGLFCSIAWTGMVETIKIAFVATVFGFIIALPISSLAASNLAPPVVSLIARTTLAGMRSLPSIIWAVLFVVVVGFGPFAGVLAMTFYTIGYLGKLQFEAIEGIQNTPLEAHRAMGMNRLEIFVFVVIPESANNLISHMMFMFEYNVRHGTVIGLVGAGGIGWHISNYLKFLQYEKVLALLIVIFLTVVIIDLSSQFVRSFFNENNDARSKTWLSVFLPANAVLSKEEE